MGSMYCSFNGVNLADLDIYAVNVGSGLPSSPFLPSQEILEDYAMNNDTPYYFGVEKNPLELDVTFAKYNGRWTFDERREFARLLDTDDYVEFYYQEKDEPVKVHFVKYTGGVDITTNGERRGYIPVHFRCDSPFSYSQMYTTVNDLSGITVPTIIAITNNGDDMLYPELWIEKVENGSVSIKQLTNGGTECTINNLLDGEIVYIDHEDGSIHSSLSDTYRYGNHNGNYIQLVRGVNNLQVTGKCRLQWKYRYKIKG